MELEKTIVWIGQADTLDFFQSPIAIKAEWITVHRREERCFESVVHMAGWPCLMPRATLDVPLLGRFGTSSAEGGLASHSHCFSEDSEAVAHPSHLHGSSRATQPAVR